MRVEYRNIYIHFVFTTINRLPLISEKHRDRIEKYITGIIANNDCQLYAIYANPDHMHFLISKKPTIDEQTIASAVEQSSAKFTNENKLCVGNFQWQDTCSAFSASKSDVDRVCKYILNQKEHHKKMTFAEEYDLFLTHYQKTINPDKTK